MSDVRTLLTVGLVLTMATTASAANSVSIESKSVPAGATGVELRVMFANDDTLTFFELPLEIRQVTPGSYVERIGVRFRDRVASAWPVMQYPLHYDRKGVTLCGSPGDSTFYPIVDTLPYIQPPESLMTVPGPPWGLLVSAFRWVSDPLLPPGQDTLGSVVLVLDVTSTPGTFEIDTTCVNPAHHIGYVYTHPVDLLALLRPSFTKGVITIVACDCSYHGDLDANGVIDVVDLNLLVDWVFYSIGPPPSDSGCPHVDRGDVNCDGYDDAVDVNYLADYINMGGSPPCDPCECASYPDDCP